MKKYLHLTMAVAIALLPVIAHTQATLTQTTLSSAVNSPTQTRWTVASATGISAGTRLFVDREMATVTSITGTTAVVVRGQSGTSAGRHASGAVVYAGPAGYFSTTDPLPGPCDATTELALPRVVVQSGNIYNCANSIWTRLAMNGYPASPSGPLYTTYTAAGALAVAPGFHMLNGTTLAMTLANPTVAQNGMVMIISAVNASAHTVTYTAGFGGGTTARDVATFGGAIGDNLTIFANGGVWWIWSTRNITLA